VPPDCPLVRTVYLLVAFPHGRSKRGLKQRRRDAPAAAVEIDVRTKHTDVIERMRVIREWLHALKANDLVVGLSEREKENAPGWKLQEVLSLCLCGEQCVEDRVCARLDNRVQNADDGFRIVRLRLANLEVHRRPQCSAARTGGQPSGKLRILLMQVEFLQDPRL